MPQIKEWLESATIKLSAANISSASIDVELILAHAFEKDRSFLRAFDDQNLTDEQTKIANLLLDKRLQRVPIAYLVGYKYFYGRKFTVNENTLIPRPESEDIIEILKSIIPHFPTPNPQLLDVGTGSGCLGITAKLEFPNLDVTLSDISDDALAVALINAKNLSADVSIIKSDLLDNIDQKPDIIVANLPYVDESWERSPETDFEPSLALFAGNGGMELIEKLFVQADNVQTKNDFIIIESDPEQHESLTKYAENIGYKKTDQIGYIVSFKKA